MMTRSLRLNLKLAYQLTQRMMICPSKCRPLNSASTGKNRCILSPSPDHGLFAPEPDSDLWQFRARCSTWECGVRPAATVSRKVGAVAKDDPRDVAGMS